MSGRGAVVRTHGESDFVDRDILPGDTSTILSEPLRRNEIAALPGDTTTAGPTLEPRSIESVFLHQTGKPQVERSPPQSQSHHNNIFNPLEVMSVAPTPPMCERHTKHPGHPQLHRPHPESQ